MTGAPMPEGADGVVPVEDTETSAATVHILRATTPGRFIAKRGSDVRGGAVVLQRGTPLGPAQLAVAASVGGHPRIVADQRAVQVGVEAAGGQQVGVRAALDDAAVVHHDGGLVGGRLGHGSGMHVPVVTPPASRVQ